MPPPIPSKKPPSKATEKLPSSTTRAQDLIAQAKVRQGASTAFQMRNEMDAMVAQKNRENSRHRINNFQNRTGRLTSSAIVREHSRIQEARNHGQELTRELLAVALAKRRFGAGLPIDDKEAQRQFLEDRFGGAPNAEAQVRLFETLSDRLPKPSRATGAQVIQTRLQKQPQPEPEPEPEPLP